MATRTSSESTQMDVRMQRRSSSTYGQKLRRSTETILALRRQKKIFQMNTLKRMTRSESLWLRLTISQSTAMKAVMTF